MVAKEVIAWVHYQKTQGKTETEIRELLKQRGYSQQAIAEATQQPTPQNNTFHTAIAKYGTFFTTASYALLLTYALGVLTTLVATVLYKQYIVSLLCVLLLVVPYLYIREQNVYNTVRLAFLLSPITFPFFLLASSPATYRIFGISPYIAYLVIPLTALLLGILGTLLFSLMHATKKQFRAATIVFSSMIGLISALNTTTSTYATQKILEITQGVEIGIKAVNPVLATVLSFVFIIPFILKLRDEYDAEKQDYYWFAIPLGIYLLVTALVNFLLRFV